MKKRALVLACVGCLLSGCASASPTAEKPWKEEEPGIESDGSGADEEPAEENDGQKPEVLGPETGKETFPVEPEELSMIEQGSFRLTYDGNQSSVVYVTKAKQLENYIQQGAEELSRYDDAYFAKKALVLVVDTVKSGSVKVQIESITVTGEEALVTLSRRSPQYGTNDMATWLLWCEAEQGLSQLAWSVTNPACDSQKAVR